MQHEHLYLVDVLDAADKIARFVAGHEEATFMVDEQAQSAVAFQFHNIGEAMRHVSDQIKSRYPCVAWQEARSMRNFIAHQYFAIDWKTIWDTAVGDIPVLRQQIAEIIAAEFPEG